MSYLPILGLCVALVYVMAGGGAKGWRVGESILLVVAGFLALAALFGYLLSRGS